MYYHDYQKITVQHQRFRLILFQTVPNPKIIFNLLPPGFDGRYFLPKVLRGLDAEDEDEDDEGAAVEELDVIYKLFH